MYIAPSCSDLVMTADVKCKRTIKSKCIEVVVAHYLKHNAPVICNHGHVGAVDIAGLACHVLYCTV